MSIDLQDRSSARRRDRVIRRRLPLGQPEMPKHPALVALYRYWLSLCDAGLIPSRRDFQVVASATATVDLTDVDDSDALDFHHSPFDEEMARQDYRAVRDLGVPLYHDIAATRRDDTLSYARLILPFADDGRRVDRLIVASAERAFPDLVKLLD